MNDKETNFWKQKYVFFDWRKAKCYCTGQIRNLYCRTFLIKAKIIEFFSFICRKEPGTIHGWSTAIFHSEIIYQCWRIQWTVGICIITFDSKIVSQFSTKMNFVCFGIRTFSYFHEIFFQRIDFKLNRQFSFVLEKYGRFQLGRTSALSLWTCGVSLQLLHSFQPEQQFTATQINMYICSQRFGTNNIHGSVFLPW